MNTCALYMRRRKRLKICIDTLYGISGNAALYAPAPYEKAHAFEGYANSPPVQAANKILMNIACICVFGL